MYSLIMLVLISLGVLVSAHGIRRRRYVPAVAGIILTVGTAVFFWFMGFWGEWLWFDALGYGERFWEVITTRVLAGAAGIALSAGFVLLATVGLGADKRILRYSAIVLALLAGGWWGASNWDIILKWLHAAPTDLQDPIFGKPIGFYLFHLPLADSIVELALLLTVIAIIACALGGFVTLRDGLDHVSLATGELNDQKTGAFYRAGGLLLTVLALEKYLERYHLMYSPWGAVTGPGWTDVHVRLPALSVMIAVLLAMGVLLVVGPLRRRLMALFRRRIDTEATVHASLVGALAVTVIATQMLALQIVPALFQRLRVEPNEITYEKPYIANNIRLTRHGFKLQSVEKKEYPAADEFTAETVEKNRALFSNIRLWDWRALDAVYKQFQEIRLYYEFNDVDVDRYRIGRDYRQVMVSAREMELANLPEPSQTFVNRRFKYTHGYGITMTSVSEFTSQGLPDLLIRDIPPKSRHPEIDIQRPEIYYGELTQTPVIVNTREAEFDYPKGDGNATIRYPGEGGVLLDSLWRKLLFGWKFDGLRLFLSDYPTHRSRILFHRQIQERVSRLAPFLVFDHDPYIVLAEGELFWIVDAYTTSSYFPYSEPYQAEAGPRPSADGWRGDGSQTLHRFRDTNYVRNAVKAVVNAFDGSVDFYVFEPEDPIIRTWQRVFPDLFKTAGTMPPALRSHVRYPGDMLLLQGLVYAKYHMTDPTVFYNQEDLWVRATEKYYSQVQPVAPYYIMWELPRSDRPQFVLMMPFTPKNRQVSIGWIAGMCDGDNYGRLLAYQFPKEKRILGPQQVETKIDQDRFLSGQLTLWDQRGSRVIRGNVLAIPVEKTLLYVEPIYLQAETAAYPELRLVAVMHNDTLSYGESFEEALEGLLNQSAQPPDLGDVSANRPGASVAELVRDAGNAFDSYLKALGEKRFEDASRALSRLEGALRGLSQEADPPMH